MTDFRALCIELTDCLEKADWPNRYKQVFQFWVDIARAALADGPAVPDGREPASVTGQPSDQEGPSAEDVEELCEEHCFNVEGYESIECLQGLINEAIARWGNPAPQPPVDGEVEA